MSFYGELIDDYNPEKEIIYKLFSDYFNNPTLVKIKNINNTFSVYGCKLYCLLNRDCRYIICVTNFDKFSVETPVELKKLQWVNFQTRTLPDNYENLKNVHGYDPVVKGPLTSVIEKIKTEDKKACTYNCDEFPIIITLLHTEKNTSDTYQPKGTIIHALETFQTIINFKE